MATNVKNIRPRGAMARPAAAPNTFAVDDGAKEYVLTNNYGKTICKLYLRGGDMSILDRVQKLQGEIDEIVAPLNDLDIENDGSVLDGDNYAIIKEVESRVIAAIDEVFDLEGGAAAIFKTRSPFAAVHGSFFLENVLNALARMVNSAMEAEGDLAQKRMAKHLSDLNTQAGDTDAGESTDNT